MLYSVIIGVAMGFGGARPMIAIAVAFALLLYRGVTDVMLRRSPITGVESAYSSHERATQSYGAGKEWVTFEGNRPKNGPRKMTQKKPAPPKQHRENELL